MNKINRHMAPYASFVDHGLRLDPDTGRERAMLGALGLAGEGGEVVDIIKKMAFHGNELDRSHLIEELGDNLWYFQLILNTYGITWDEVIDGNVDKLAKRYPERHQVMSGINLRGLIGSSDE